MESEKVKEIKEKLKERYYYLDQAYSDHLAYGGKADEQQEEEIYFLGGIRALINELESENERLIKKNNHLLDRNRDLIRVCDTCKISIKHFAERLKEQIKAKVDYYNDEVFDYSYNGITENDIDETLKEFLK